MTALLILGGVALAVLGWCLLWWRSVRVHWGWALAGVLPPLALVSGLLNLRHNVVPLLVHVAGVVLLGGGLWQLWQTEPQQFARLLQGQWSDQVMTEELAGRLQGQAFVPEQVVLKQGVLILREGQDFIASKEIRLDLRHYGPALHAKEFALDILPTDSGEQPVIELLWQNSQTGQPEVRRIVRGYTLSLELQQQAHGIQGQLYLSLPSRLATLVRGGFQVTTAGEQPLALATQPEEAEPEQSSLQAENTSPAFSLARLSSQPQDYLRQTLYIETNTGRQIRGEFEGINDEGQLLVKQLVKAPGFAVFRVAPGEISRIELEQSAR